ncbi:MAG TPA: hypothetical protein DCS87_00940 [Rheinheimera sp.]|nr:hypothetical protein [Rheinheimera sp.]
MNNGRYLKKFFTFGRNSRELVEHFVKDWKFGFVAHTPLDLKQTQISTFDLEGEFISLFISDSDISSLNLLNAHISRLKNLQEIEVIILADTQQFQEESINWADIYGHDISLTPQVILKESGNTILECYAHFLCGASFTCLDYQSLRHWLHAGKTYISASCEAVSSKELPYTLYLEFKKLEKEVDSKQMKLAAINAVFLGDVWTIELIEATTLMLQACLSEDTAVGLHSNFHSEGLSDLAGFKLFAVLESEVDKVTDDVDDLPLFLKY